MQQTITEEKVPSTSGIFPSHGEVQKPKEMQIDSRFGKVSIQPESAINFPHGMPGIKGSLSFCLTNMPNVSSDHFRLFQNLENYALSFIVVPSTYDNQLLEPKDVADACNVLGISRENLLLLFIVTSHETITGRRLSVNAKAPVFIDAKSKVGAQYVFQGNAYDIQHFIS